MGLATAHIVGQQGPVLITDINQQRLDEARQELTAKGITCWTQPCDITDRQAVNDLAGRAQQLGQVRALIHTAGASPRMGSAELILRVNALGTVLVNAAFYEIAAEDMAIVNVASVAGHQLPRALTPVRRYKRCLNHDERLLPDLMALCRLAPPRFRSEIAYVLSKNFVIWYSKTAAAQFGTKGARVLSVSPGSFDTAMGKLEESAGAGALAQLGALKRFGKPSEIAELLAFCASEKASYLTGTDIVCDGGVLAAMTPTNTLKLALAH